MVISMKLLLGRQFFNFVSPITLATFPSRAMSHELEKPVTAAEVMMARDILARLERQGPPWKQLVGPCMTAASVSARQKSGARSGMRALLRGSWIVCRDLRQPNQ